MLCFMQVENVFSFKKQQNCKSWPMPLVSFKSWFFLDLFLLCYQALSNSLTMHSISLHTYTHTHTHTRILGVLQAQNSDFCNHLLTRLCFSTIIFFCHIPGELENNQYLHFIVFLRINSPQLLSPFGYMAISFKKTLIVY